MNVPRSLITVWPAFDPPWKRTTASASRAKMSTILPLPSSPHWAPMTTRLAIHIDLKKMPWLSSRPGSEGHGRDRPNVCQGAYPISLLRIFLNPLGETMTAFHCARHFHPPHPLARRDVPWSQTSTAKQNLFDPEPVLMDLGDGIKPFSGCRSARAHKAIMVSPI